MLRKATEKDIARIAEILVFTKRTTYRDIFKNDYVSFNVIQVLSEAENLRKPNALKHQYVYDDGVVKAIINAEVMENEIKLSDFYVDPFFQKEGIGTFTMKKFIDDAKKDGKKLWFWVLNKNVRAIEFYEKLGFKYSGIKEEFEDSGFYILRYEM